MATTVVARRASLRITATISNSLAASKWAVGSSKSSRRARLKKVRASATRWTSPPDSPQPPSPI